MSNTTMNVKIYLDTKTTEQWAAVTQAIPKGYMCVELAENATLLKVGDGVNTFADLPYTGAVIDVDQIVKDAVAKELEKLGAVFDIKGTVASVSELPAENNEKGDVYLVGGEDDDDLTEYYWTGSKWDFMGTAVNVDLSNYYTKAEVDGLLEDCIKSGDTLILNCTL
ncbi:MAG: hypothetical protein HDT47_00505 [Ruminococcaceae bacterium]|nr:hypothetical protein [Oscillospiraceae bacterium]